MLELERVHNLNDRMALLAANVVIPILKGEEVPGGDSDRALQMLLAITGQEANAMYRNQIVPGRKAPGPALGLLQFEKGGGVRGVLRHPASKDYAARALARRNVAQNEDAAWLSLMHDDSLAFIFGRLLLWTDPKPLPDTSDAGAGWDYYERNWRPGKPHPQTWARNWQAATLARQQVTR